MQEIEHKIFVSHDIIEDEWDWTFGKKRGLKVTFTYHNIKTGKETSTSYFNYKEALELARSRARDGRYKNYEFIIDL